MSDDPVIDAIEERASDLAEVMFMEQGTSLNSVDRAMLKVGIKAGINATMNHFELW